MFFLGITGGVGAGKSEILSYLRNNYNSQVMLTDEIAHDLMEPGTDCYTKLQVLFAEDSVYQTDGRFDRPALAQVIFGDDSKREAMNAIVHPAVKQYVKGQHALALADHARDLLVVESALLIDDNYGAICDEMWYIYTTEDNRRSRLKASRGYSDEKIDSIFASQLREEDFRAHCNQVIDNNGTVEESIQQMKKLLEERGL